jgi:hypothetical protein
MEEHHLGPNGGMMYCISYLAKNIEWLFDKLERYNGNSIAIKLVELNEPSL